jgi:hypothetical protein
VTTKALDTGNVERTISQVKVMDVGGIERTIQFIRVMDVGGVVREVFTAGGAGSASIEPAYMSWSGRSGSTPAYRSGIFKAKPVGTATSFQWNLVSGPGAVSSGGATDTATLTIYGSVGQTVTAVFNCDMVVSGTPQSAQCTLSFNFRDTIDPVTGTQ